MKRRIATAVIVTALLTPTMSQAWGRRGHAVVCETAAILLAQPVMREHSFDLGYYCNVPDLVWKKPPLYKLEWFNHFMDLEIFARLAKPENGVDPFSLSRAEFNAKYPEVKEDAGRAYWRIRELFARLGDLANQLRASNEDTSNEPAKEPNNETTAAKLKRRHRLQSDWLVTAGAIGHYVGDLSQPLHVTENYDGKMTDQPGIHAFFEDTLVDAIDSGILGSPKKLAGEVAAKALKIWKKRQSTKREKANSVSNQMTDAALLGLLAELAKQSNAEIPALLADDRRVGRSGLSAAAKAHHRRIVERLAAGAVTLAEIWQYQLAWPYNNERFFNFETEPTYLQY